MVTIPAKSNFAKIATVNVVPHSYAPNIKNKHQLHQGSNNCQQKPAEVKFDEGQGINIERVPAPPALTPERESLLFSKINLEGTKDWNEELKIKTKDLFRDFAHVSLH